MKKANYFYKIFGFLEKNHYICIEGWGNLQSYKEIFKIKIIMTTRIKEIKSFIEGDLYNPYEGQEFKYEEYGDDGFQVISDCFTLKVDLSWGDLSVVTHPGCSLGKYDFQWFMSIDDSLMRLQHIWDEYTDVE